MPSDLFTTDGVARWQRVLNTSTRFADAAADWVGSLLLVEAGEEAAPRQAWVRIDRGWCLEAREGRDVDAEAADFVLTASAATWRALVSATITPAKAALTGRLRLTKGEVFGLIPHARAAAELLAAAAESPDAP
ncbi:MAG: hypothetical protein V4503_08845 [Gemmatimonadota bacterium]